MTNQVIFLSPVSNPRRQYKSIYFTIYLLSKFPTLRENQIASLQLDNAPFTSGVLYRTLWHDAYFDWSEHFLVEQTD